jgi:TonB family protein
LWIIYTNIKANAPVFNVDIVGPLETEKPSAPNILQPNIAPHRPLIERQNRSPFDEKLSPETLHGEGRGVQPEGIKNNPPVSKGGNTPLPLLKAPTVGLDRGELSPPLEKGDAGGFSDDKGALPSEKVKPFLAPPSALFDKKTIENYANKETDVDKGLTFEIPGFQHRGYMRMLKEKIESIWRYPKEAARLGMSGDLYIKFAIKKDGKLGEIDLLRTSGYKDLDEAAMKALKDAEPFWPLPADWEKDDLEINGHFIYVYGNAVLM